MNNKNYGNFDYKVNPKYLDGRLNFHARMQKEVSAYDSVPESIHQNSQAILDWFSQTERFRQIIDEAANITLKRGGLDAKTQELLHARIFQDLAYSYSSSTQPPYFTLLSPERTLTFFQEMFPTRRLIREPFGLHSLDGISVPDGLSTRKTADSEKAVFWYEYTLSRRHNNSGKYNGFQINRKMAHFAQDSEIIYVVPEASHVPDAVFNQDNTSVQQTPFTASQLYAFFKHANEIIEALASEKK